MNNFLRNIKLIDSFSISLNTSKSEFTSALRNHVDDADIDSMFSGAFEAFSSSKNRYKGKVYHNSFKIRRRRRFFEKNYGKTIATGKLRDQGETLLIDTQISAWNNFMFFFIGFVALMYIIAILTIFRDLFSNDSEIPVFVPFFIIIHAALMFGIPYFILRRNVRRLKEDLEREFYFIINKSNSFR